MSCLLINYVSLTSYLRYSEGVTIPKNPRTERSVGYAFVDLSTPTEAERAIAELSGKEILERKVSVQLARKPEPNAEKTDTNGEGEGTRRRQSTRGRGRGTRARGGRAGRAREVRQTPERIVHLIKRTEADIVIQDKKEGDEGAAAAPVEAPAATEVQPLQDITNQTNNTDPTGKNKTQARPARERRERGPPADGIASKTKVMVANLPYDLTEEKASEIHPSQTDTANSYTLYSSRSSSARTSHLRPRSLCDLSPAS